MSNSDQSTTGGQQEEPDRVWEVDCECGYSEMYRHYDDAREVYEAHVECERCGVVSLRGMHAYSEGGTEPEKTLPYDIDEDPKGLTEPEVHP